MKKALIVIDMQKGSFSSETPRFDSTGVINRINILANLFRAKNMPIIFIQHDGSKQNGYIPNTEDWELLSELNVDPVDIFVGKSSHDSFYQTDLEFLLAELNVQELFVTGCATDFCVESTIQSALSKDYDIIVVRDGHTTGDRPNIVAEKIVEYYNWVWENMIPTSGRILVKGINDIVEDINFITI